ncbi:MAG TPA: hypothetical protein VFH48_09645, partial [Chloroflexota bacterium]|nr:hypothetical protein [Chloroflexota bacterium]
MNDTVRQGRLSTAGATPIRRRAMPDRYNSRMSVPAGQIATIQDSSVVCFVCDTSNFGTARFCEACGTRLL